MKLQSNTIPVLVMLALIAIPGVSAAWGKLTAQEFVQKASMSNMFEIESSKLALERAQKPETRQFAQMMIRDHTQAGNDLKAAVEDAKLGTALMAATLDEDHQEKMDKLRDKSAEDFDAAYMEMQEDAHDDAVGLFERYAENGDQPRLKQFASKTLPVLRQHEKHTDKMD